MPAPRECHATHAPAPDADHKSASERDAPKRGSYNSEWARLMHRAFELDVLCCPKCSGRMRVLALIDNPRTARRILRHLGMRDHAPPIAAARIPDRTFHDVA